MSSAKNVIETHYFVFTQRQSQAYPPQNEPRVVHDLIECCNQYSNLHPIIDTFTSTEGTNQRLVALRGTIPVSYKGIVYKIPVHVWVMPYHPLGPPLMHVVPSRSMIFRQRHPHVDYTNGLVYLPYLSHWDPLTSTIDGAVRAMIHAFSIKPPVYSRGRNSGTGEDLERRQLIRALTQRMSEALLKNTNAAMQEVGGMLKRKDSLLREDPLRQSMKRQLSRQKLELETGHEQLESRKKSLEQWNELHPAPPTDANIDQITRPRTVLQDQNLECSAQDAAMADALDQMDEAIAKGVIDTSTYMREVRRVAREQFFVRALGNRVLHMAASTESRDSMLTSEEASCSKMVGVHATYQRRSNR